MKEEIICPGCRFPNRISGHIFIKKFDINISRYRCKICGHFPDYIIRSSELKKASIIYRTFTDSEEYFKGIKKYLESNGFKIIKLSSSHLD